MSTTVIFAEILIVGVQTMIWLTLLIISYCGVGWIHGVKEAIEGIEVLATVTLMTLIYTLGIMMDLFSNGIFSLILRPERFLIKIELIKRRYVARNEDGRISISCELGGALDILKSVRSRIKVLRGTAVNLIALVVVLMISIQKFSISIGMFSYILLVFVIFLLAVISIIAVGILEVLYGWLISLVMRWYSKMHPG